MIFLVLFVVWVLGYSLLSFLGKNFNIALKLGLSMLLGLGIQSVLMLVFDAIHVPITLASLLLASVLIAAALSIKNLPTYKVDIEEVRRTKIGFGQLNFIWIFFFCLVCYFTYGIAKKGIYWPTTEYDSVAGYDYMAKMIASERVLHVSLFQYTTDANIMARFIYPPLVAGSLALQHICGPLTPKIIPTIFFVFLLISFYGGIRYFTTHTAAMIATAFMALTPEMFSHAALSLTNLPNAAYASMAIITFYIWTINKDNGWLYLSAIVMAFTLFSRSDSIVFSAAVLAWMLYDSFRTKNFKPLLVYAVLANSLFLLWTLYTKFVLKSDSTDLFEKTLFWDTERLDKIFGYIADFMVWETQFYGIGFWALYALLLLNIRILKNDLTAFILVSVGAWVLYTFLYYQMNYKVATLDMFMKASYKRGMFCFVPLAWFYVISNRRSVWLFEKLDGFMYK